MYLNSVFVCISVDIKAKVEDFDEREDYGVSLCLRFFVLDTNCSFIIL